MRHKHIKAIELLDQVDKDYLEKAINSVGYKNKHTPPLECHWREDAEQWECFVWSDDDISIWVQSDTLHQCYQEIWLLLMYKKPSSLYDFILSNKGPNE